MIDSDFCSNEHHESIQNYEDLILCDKMIISANSRNTPLPPETEVIKLAVFFMCGIPS